MPHDNKRKTERIKNLKAETRTKYQAIQYEKNILILIDYGS